MQIIADHDICTGHARCQECCPEVFSTDDSQGKVIVLLRNVPAQLQLSARLAVRNCPEGALTIIEAENGQND